ncbi:MAG TPA: NAD-dependent epimerase/dehydratase family protein [Kofleriaceae bacterium]|nr:NAD-dependent epimerase/dehydratase family protein [Kofleriaceae bacterium]
MSDSLPLALVTGGAGFIGSHTVDALVAAGWQVVVLDDFSTGKRENLRQWQGDARVEVIAANVADGLFAPLHQVTRRRGPVQRIIHLAAQTSVVYSIENPLDEVRTNYTGTVQVLDYARRTGVARVVFASSAAVYGDVAALPVAEEADCRPLSPYGIDKRAAELWLGYHAAVHGLAAVPLRFFNVYGPRQDPSSPYSGVISIFVDRAMSGRELVVFGDGEQTRDFIYVSDVVRAILAAAASPAGDGQPINVATGRETTVNQLASEVARLCGSQAGIRHAEARPGEILRSVARVSRARERIGFAAEVALADGLARTIEWVRGGAAARGGA